jgi:hypothetical protein
MRSTWHTWIFRCVALLIFISGGALARAVVQDLETHFSLPSRESGEQQLKAVTLEVRQPAPVQLEGMAVAQVPVFRASRPSQFLAVWLEVRPSVAGVRLFDALAPPLNIAAIFG